MKLKTGDKVRVMAGKDKGKEGAVLQVFPKLNRAVVEGINLMTKHLRKQHNRAGQKISFPAPLHVSNLQVISPKSGAFGRVGYKFIERGGTSSEDGSNSAGRTKIRVIRSKGQTEDLE